MPAYNRPACRRCDAPALLRHQVTASGGDQYGWYCEACKVWAVKDKPFISKMDAGRIVAHHGSHLTDVPTINGFIPDPCIICGKLESETHHLAPQEFADQFDNFPAWPTCQLCRQHHNQWHEIVQGRKIR